MTSEKDRLAKIAKASGRDRDLQVKAAFRAGVSATKLAEASKQDVGTLIRKLARGGW